jgi:hypothetical protein
MAKAMAARLALRARGRNHCGRYSLSNNPTCPDPGWAEPNNQLLYTTSCGTWSPACPRKVLTIEPNVLLATLGVLAGATIGTYDVPLAAGSGSGARVVVTVDSATTVSAITVVLPGTGYLPEDHPYIEPNQLGTGSTQLHVPLQEDDFVCPPPARTWRRRRMFSTVDQLMMQRALAE